MVSSIVSFLYLHIPLHLYKILNLNIKAGLLLKILRFDITGISSLYSLLILWSNISKKFKFSLLTKNSFYRL